MNPQDIQPGTPQQQVSERLKTAVNVLVTVSNNPSVDQLAAAIGFTLTLNKMGKHATAVFSGDVPSTIEFLKPEATIEKNTDSLRDFIVSLDKSKADKLRYKVEENVVKIFITPYRTSLSEADLNFSQGDFNVDAVVALGLSEREQLDQAIVSHGRILHDATVITVSAGAATSSLGAINWQDVSASSLCEMLAGVAESLQPRLLDSQIATAYLTGIVAQTERFRNDKTTPKLMTLAAQLMAAGANQQLVATELDKHATLAATVVPVAGQTPTENTEAQSTPDGSISIAHESGAAPAAMPPAPEEPTELPEPVPEASPTEEVPAPDAQIAIDEHGNIVPASATAPSETPKRRVIEPLPEEEKHQLAERPEVQHPFTANMSAEPETQQSIDPLAGASSAPDKILSHDAPAASAPVAAPVPSVSATQPDPSQIATIPPAFDDNTLRDIEKTFVSPHITKDPTSTLNEIEEVVGSPHLAQAEEEKQVDSARDAVQNAIAQTPYDPARPEPLQALNAAPVELTPPDPLQPVVAAVAPGSTPALTYDSTGQTPPLAPPPFMPPQ